MELDPEATRNLMLVVTFILMLVGLVFTVVPPIPGTIVIWAAAALYGLVLGWEKIGWFLFSILTVLMIFGLVVDIIAGQFGAKMGGASWQAILVGALISLLCGILGSFFGTPIVGCIAAPIGMIGGVLWVEWKRNDDWDKALRATKGYLTGTALGVMARATTGAIMIVIFGARVYFWG